MKARSGFVRVLPSEELSAHEGLESEIRRLRIGDEILLVGRLASGKVVAFCASCPHEMTDLGQATFVDGMVRCPRHNYLYDPHSGANVIPTDVARRESLWKLRPGYLPTYQVEEDDGWVWVKTQANPAPAGWDPTSEERPDAIGHLTAETVSPCWQEPPVPTVALRYPTERLLVRLGEEFEVRVPTMPKPAHAWRIDVPAAMLTVVAQSFDPAGTPPHLGVRLRAHADGEGTMRCCYARPWDIEPAEIRDYVVHVAPP